MRALRHLHNVEVGDLLTWNPSLMNKLSGTTIPGGLANHSEVRLISVAIAPPFPPDSGTSITTFPTTSPVLRSMYDTQTIQSRVHSRMEMASREGFFLQRGMVTTWTKTPLPS